MKSVFKVFLSVMLAGLNAGTVAAWPVAVSPDGTLPGLVRQLRADAPAMAAPGKAPVAEWTVMVYVNAKNDLEYFGLADLNEMEAAGSTDRVNVVAELGRLAVYDEGDGGWSGVRRYLVKKDDAPKAITSPVLESLEADMGDWRHLAEFGKWAKKNFPAKHYMLVVWNHGSGWDKSFGPGNAFKGISYDYGTGSHISTPQLAAALREMGKVDVLAFDACLMQMAEVAYEVREQAGFMVGSEETEPGPGYPYDTFLGRLLAEPGLAPERLATALVDAYYAYYKDKPGLAAMQSALKTAALPRFLELVNGWTAAVMASGDRDSVNVAVRAAQRFDTVENKDVYDFISLTQREAAKPEITAKSGELLKFISEELVLKHRSAGDNYPGSHGLAAFLPVRHYVPEYDELQWAKDSKWDEFIEWYPQ